MAKEQLTESLEVAIQNFQDKILSFIEKAHDESNLVDPMNQLAKQLLYGGYIHVTSPTVNRRIYLHAVEFYYHEADSVSVHKDSRITDYVMYHIPDFVITKKERDKFTSVQKEMSDWNETLFPVGTLVGHTSGIDLTFEDVKDRYRASVLFREYIVVEDNQIDDAVVNSRSTFLKDELLHAISVFDSDSPLSIQWVNDPYDGVLDIEDKVRTGVNKKTYDKDKKEVVEEKVSDGRNWHFKRKGGITAFKKQYRSRNKNRIKHAGLSTAFDNDAKSVIEDIGTNVFDSHRFIQVFSRKNHREYVLALHDYLHHKPNALPFNDLHADIARSLHGVEGVYPLCDVESKTIFGEMGKNKLWIKK